MTGVPKERKLKDIFVDSCVAVRLENPLDPQFVDFLAWLAVKGAPVLTPKLLKEYGDSLSLGASNFIAILNACQRDGRVIEFTNDEMKALSFTKKQERELQSNRKDWWHIKAVLLSPRKLALSFDTKFVIDVNAFPGYRARAAKKPVDLSFK